MALFGLLGGGAEEDDPYKDILTPAQRNEMQTRGLAAMAAAFAKAGQASWLPQGLGSAIGEAAGALGAGQEAGMTAALQNALRAQQVRDLRTKAASRKQLDAMLQKVWEDAGRTGPAPGTTAAGGGGGGAGAGGGGAAPAAGDGGDLLSPDFALGNYANALPAAAPAGLPNYPAQTGTTRFGGGGLLGGGFDPGLGTEDPLSAYKPGGDLDPFRASAQRGLTGAAAGAPSVEAPPPGYEWVVPGKTMRALPAAPGQQAPESANIRAYRNAYPPNSGGGLLGPGFGGGSTAADLGAGGDEPVAAAPGGGGLLALAQDLRAPVEADPFRRVDAVIRQIQGRETGGFANPYAVRPEQNVDFPRSHASGAHQWQPGTWRQWTEASGYGTEYPEAYQAPPRVQDAVARYAALHGDVNAMNLWGASAKSRPYPSPFEGGGLPPDEVIPTGGTGTRPPVVQAQYAPGGAGPAPLAPPGSLPALPAPGGAPPLGAGGKIPGLNMTPQQLAIIDAMAESAGLGNPFKGLLDTYYKSPGYLGDIKRQEKQIELETAGPITGATEAAKAPYIRQQMKEKLGEERANALIQLGILQLPDGRLVQAPQEPGIFAQKEAATPTGDMKDYIAYTKDQQMRNQPVLSFFDWNIAQKKAGAASTVLNTQEGFESAQIKARIAIDQKAAEPVMEQAAMGRRIAPLLDEVIRLANQTPEGWAGPVAAQTARAFSAFGLPVTEGMSNAELLQTITQRLVPVVREPGATSQGEMATYLQASPGLMQSAAGRIKIAEMTKALIARTDQIAQVYRDNLGDKDLFAKLRALDKPLWTDEQRAAMDEAIRMRTGGPPPTAPRGGGTITTPYGTISPVQ